jgi:hypothetical protein
MTLLELKAHYETARNMIQAERAMRRHVLASSPELGAKLAECDRALAAVVAMKDELKLLLAPAVQEPLIDVPETKKIGGY